MQYLWWGHGINLKLHVYDVMSTGFMSGLVEIVPSSTIGALHATAGGTSTDGTVVKHLKSTFCDVMMFGPISLQWLHLPHSKRQK